MKNKMRRRIAELKKQQLQSREEYKELQTYSSQIEKIKEMEMRNHTILELENLLKDDRDYCTQCNLHISKLRSFIFNADLTIICTDCKNG